MLAALSETACGLFSCVWRPWFESPELMLMMLELAPTDAHDALGFVFESAGQPAPADAHDARGFGFETSASTS